MADVEVHAAEPAHGRVQTLHVRFKNAPERTIDRATALAWLAEGHALLTYAGTPQHPHKGYAIQRGEVDGEAFLRTDTELTAADHLVFPDGGHH